eukprot:gnl/TRDRNA2_/TRDRNA2_181370_c0_seq1.p1 gnl/TRDRNA2_/TRDRNA2_181370_c0~~gnl/TRDRNA2_/TRDRNA2_181370_c0_seq1.p1  ORF type:complete len:877 (-),score=197.58 gnl/TRDRNA2_/TRDRNA2_181370_c0_seq1:65-2572(-)
MAPSLESGDPLHSTRQKWKTDVEAGQQQAKDEWKRAEKTLTRALKKGNSHGGGISGGSSLLAGSSRETAATDGRGANASTSRLRCSSETDFASSSGVWSGDDEDEFGHASMIRASQTGGYSSSDDEERRFTRASENRCKLMRIRAANAAESTAFVKKKRLRAKIAHILDEVYRRQDLRKAQERSAKVKTETGMRNSSSDFRLDPAGPAEELGDHTVLALGLHKLVNRVTSSDGLSSGHHSHNSSMAASGGMSSIMLPSSATAAPGQTSPRRTQIIECLSVEELGMMRRDVRFYFGGQVAAAAEARANATAKNSPGGGKPSAKKKARRPGTADSDEDRNRLKGTSLEELVDFFTLDRVDAHLDSHGYVQKLKKKLGDTTKAPRRDLSSALSAGGGTSHEWCRRIIVAANGANSSAGAEASQSNQKFSSSCPNLSRTGSTMMSSTHSGFLTSHSRVELEPLEMMPSLGRHPLVDPDQTSPTLDKVRAVYNRRNEADARMVEERAEHMARRMAVNEFKAKEQQRELQLQVIKQKALHKVRMLEAEERKAVYDATAEQRRDQAEFAKAKQRERAEVMAEWAKEGRREIAKSSLERWRIGKMRSEQYLREEERTRYKKGDQNNAAFMAKLANHAEQREVNKEMRMTARLEEEEKRQLKSPKSASPRERHLKELQKNAELDEKLAAAAERRAAMRPGMFTTPRYDFLERAFGQGAREFDWKHHAVQVDRRCQTWRKTHDSWTRQKDLFNTPKFASTWSNWQGSLDETQLPGDQAPDGVNAVAEDDAAGMAQTADGSTAAAEDGVAGEVVAVSEEQFEEMQAMPEMQSRPDSPEPAAADAVE